MTGPEWIQKTGFSYRLKKARMNAHMTQRMAAISLHINASYISSIESGEFVPSIQRVAQLALLYDVSIDYLVGKDVPPND